jgi:hypothetical protein
MVYNELWWPYIYADISQPFSPKGQSFGRAVVRGESWWQKHWHFIQLFFNLYWIRVRIILYPTGLDSCIISVYNFQEL